MDPVVMITTALKLGALGLAAGTLEEGGGDLYRSLKGRLVKQFHGKPEAELALVRYEEKPEVWQAPLQEAILESGAAEDNEIVQLAEALLALLKQESGVSAVVNTGSGAIAQGPGAVAAGERGVAISGDVNGSVIVTGDGNRVDAGRDSDS